MTAANPNTPSHPYLRQEQFRDPMFIRIRRRVALLRLPYAEDEIREVLLDTIGLYDEMLGIEPYREKI